MPASLTDWLDFIEQQHPKSIDMGLERVRAVAQRMGLGKPARQVITVGGTNGKGSTVAFIEAIARANGWRVGAYTSPHLLAYNERVRIDGRNEDDELVEAFEAVEGARVSPSTSGVKPHGLRATGARVAERHARCAGPGRGAGVGVRAGGGRNGSDRDDFAQLSSGPSGHPGSRALRGQALFPEEEGKDEISLTYFEFGTLAALWLFERAQLDLAILEVGLGGRLDATNIVDPDVAVITTVDLDHQDWLGDDRETIGIEKAGIARAWKPLVLGEDDPPSSVLRHAYAIGASAIRAGSDYLFEPIDASSWRWREPGFEAELPMPSMPAPIQLRNAATAIAALRALPEAVAVASYAAGIRQANVAGRLQRFDRAGVAVLVDVGHNPQAARQLAQALSADRLAGRTWAVYAALSDKDHGGVVDALRDAVDAWWLAGSLDAGARGMDVDSLAGAVAASGIDVAGRYPDVASALSVVLEQASAGDRVLVFGSFHAAEQALRALNEAATS